MSTTGKTEEGSSDDGAGDAGEMKTHLSDIIEVESTIGTSDRTGDTYHDAGDSRPKRRSLDNVSSFGDIDEDEEEGRRVRIRQHDHTRPQQRASITTVNTRGSGGLSKSFHTVPFSEHHIDLIEGGEVAAGEDQDPMQHSHRVRRRQRDRRDFATRTSITTNTSITNLIGSTDEDPNFWEVSGRWFSDAGDFVGELAGMTSRRASDTSYDADDAVDAAAFLPRVDGVEIVSAADDDDDYDEDPSNPDQFDDLSSLGDTPTYFTYFTARSVRKNLIRGAWFITLCLMIAWIAAQAALQSSTWFHEWTSGNRVSVFAPRGSRRYNKLRAKLVHISGEEAFMNEASPQHMALMYLADGDSLLLDPNDDHPAAMIQLVQRYVLAVFYFSTGGPNWKSKIYWLTGRHECGWQGIICSFVNNETANDDEVYFSNDDDYSNTLDGDLELEDAKTITGLSIYGRDLQGAIPKEIGALEYLHVLDLGNNNLTGVIGTQFGKLQHLHKLYLGHNQLTGGLEAIQWLTTLKRVNVENNQLSGTIPFDIGKNAYLEEVRFGQNKLYGHIPSSLLKSKTLTKLDLHGNQLTGELNVYEHSILEYLYLYDNMLSGELPPGALCNVSTSLIDLRLNNNSFTGQIPDIGCTMQKLALFSLAQNNLTGYIYDSLGDRMPRLREIHLYENMLLSTIPDSLFRPENLTSVLLGNNALTGSLTADMFKDARKLAHFYVNSNHFGGNLDDFAKADLSRMKKLRLEYNSFTGTIPKMKLMETVELLYMYNNSFTGNIDNLISGVNLRKLKVSNNSLEGEITPKLGDLKRLEILSLNGNNLVGTIPNDLRKLSALEELHVENNDITGMVPQGVCDLRKSELGKFVSDCAGQLPEVSCSCCTECF